MLSCAQFSFIFLGFIWPELQRCSCLSSTHARTFCMHFVVVGSPLLLYSLNSCAYKLQRAYSSSVKDKHQAQRSLVDAAALNQLRAAGW